MLSPTEFASAVTAITSAFGDPTRREIYLFAHAHPEGVSAGDTAKHFDLHANVARHHLDKVASGGYLDVDLAKQRTSLRTLKKRCDDLGEAITEADDTIRVTAERLEPLERQLSRRAAAMLRLRRTPMSDVLSRAGSIVEARRLREGLRRVMRYDAELVQKTRATALEARRTELEALIAEDLERRLVSDVEEIEEIITNSVEPVAISTDSWMANTRGGSHFTMTWFAVPTS